METDPKLLEILICPVTRTTLHYDRERQELVSKGVRRITAVTADKQVGDGWVGPMGQPGSVRHALVWSGSAASVIDLNQFLPPGYTHAAGYCFVSGAV